MNTISEILMRRDGCSLDGALAQIRSARVSFNEYLDSGDTEAAYNVCEEYFGLEPDYIWEMML